MSPSAFHSETLGLVRRRICFAVASLGVKGMFRWMKLSAEKLELSETTVV